MEDVLPLCCHGSVIALPCGTPLPSVVQWNNSIVGCAARGVKVGGGIFSCGKDTENPVEKQSDFLRLALGWAADAAVRISADGWKSLGENDMIGIRYESSNQMSGFAF